MVIELFEHNQTAYEAVEQMLIEREKAAIAHPVNVNKIFLGFTVDESIWDKPIYYCS